MNSAADEFARRAVAFDTETWKIAPGLAAPPLVCGSSAGMYNGLLQSWLHDPQGTRTFFYDSLKHDHVICGANVAYDMLVMASDSERNGQDILPYIFEKYERQEVYDVLIAEALDAIARGQLLKDEYGAPLCYPGTRKQVKRYSLDVVTRLVLGREDAKALDFWRMRYAILEKLPIDQWPDDARQYPLDDARNTLEVALAQVGYLPRADGQKRRAENLHDQPNQAYTAWCRQLNGAWGLRTNQAAVRALANRVGGDRARRVQEFIDAGILREDETKDTKLIASMVSDAYGGDLHVPKTPTSRVSTSRDALANSGNDLLESFAEFGEEDKIRTTYLPLLEQAAARPAVPRANVVLKTGRLSYDEVWQQFPREGGVRECFEPRPGFVFVSCDYKQLELAAHAQSCLWIVGYSKLAEAINADFEPHDAMGARMAGIEYEDFLARRKTEKALGDYRQAAKPANFGFPGGMGAYKLVLQQRKQGPDTVGPDGRVWKGLRFCILIGGTSRCGETMIMEWKRRTYPPACKRCVECAEEIKSAWTKQWPENDPYFLYVKKQVDWVGHIEQHVSKRTRGGITFTEAANGYFQALAADGAKLADRRATREAYTDRSSPLYGSRLVLFAHDELIAEVPEASAHEAATRLGVVMVEAMQQYIPDVKISAEPALMRKWYKGAACVRNDSGRLIPWEPSATE